MKNLFALSLLLLIFSCGNSSRSVESSTDYSPPSVSNDIVTESTNEAGDAKIAAEPESDSKQEDKTAQDLTPNTQKLIKNGYITIEVENYKEIRKKINEIVNKNGGYIGNESETNETYRITNDITVRRPSASFDKVMELIIAEGIKTDNKRIEVSDVGEEYADLTTRIATKKAVEKRFLEILNKAVKVSDVLEVEDKLRVIREEIEAAEGRIKYLNHQVSFSTIQLSMYKTLDSHYTPPSGPSFFARIWKGFVQGWEGLVNFIIGLVYLWPLWLIVVLFIFWIKKRKFKLKFPKFRKK